jgi:hypothetical protein
MSTSPEPNPQINRPAASPVTEPIVRLADPWEVRTFGDAMRAEATGTPWTIQDLLPDETVTLVAAQPHAMKSLSWLEASLEAVTYHSVWTEFKAPDVERALFVETEDPPWLVEARIRGFAKGLNIHPRDEVPGFHYACTGPFDLLRERSKLRRLLEKVQPDFAVLSTLQNLLAGKSWQKPEDMQPVYAVVLELARSCCPIVLITHSPWDKRQKRAAGTVTQVANCVTTLHYEKILNRKTGETFAHVLLDSKAGAMHDDFHFKLTTEGDGADPESVRDITYEGRGWPKGIAKDAVMAALEDDPNASPKEIAERCNVSVRYVERIIKEWKSGRKQAAR